MPEPQSALDLGADAAPKRRVRRQPRRLTNEQPEPYATVYGFAAALAVLKRCECDLRPALIEAAVNSGVRGASGLRYLAERILWHLGEIDFPLPEKLSSGEISYVEDRAREIVQSFRYDRRMVPESRLRGL
jgi:hypothetical protein